jgi:hypothetical protein
VSYDYQSERVKLFTEENQKLFLGIRDRVRWLLSQSGAVRMNEAMAIPKGIGGADSWTMLACVDRLVELGELVEVTAGQKVAGQYRVFVAKYEAP